MRNHCVFIIIIVTFVNVQTCACVHEYLKILKVLIMIGVSLSEPNMYMTAMCVSLLACWFGPTTYCILEMSTSNYFTKVEQLGGEKA